MADKANTTPETVTVDTLWVVPRHGVAGVERAIALNPAGDLIIVEKPADGGKAALLRTVTFEEILRTAEHVLAGNPTAVTWPPCQMVLAAGFLAAVANAKPDPDDGAPPAASAPDAPAAGAL